MSVVTSTQFLMIKEKQADKKTPDIHELTTWPQNIQS